MDYKYVIEENQFLINEIETLLADLNTMLDKTKTQKNMKDKPDRELLRTILEACQTFDMDTVEAAIKELEKFQYETENDLISWLWENVQQFNVDEIVERLSSMKL
jgi:uncharacterized protein YutE (UPF0331/DUF86 family)